MIRQARRLCFVTAVFLASALAASAASSAKPVGQETAMFRITYLVFSGRPNPSFITNDEALMRDLDDRLVQARVSGMVVAASEEDQPVLGYNGVQIERLGPGGATTGLIVVKGSRLQVIGDSKGGSVSSVLESFNDSIESHLLSLGQERSLLSEQALRLIKQ